MQYREYFGDPFRADLRALLSGLPSHHKHEPEVMVQPRTISAENPVIDPWNSERRQLFATALFFTVLVDQVAYTHYRGDYVRFRALTQYPKFRGDCPGACNYHLHPNYIFRAFGAPARPGATWASGLSIATGAEEVMHVEVQNFFSKHMPGIDATDFWNRCVSEIAS